MNRLCAKACSRLCRKALSLFTAALIFLLIPALAKAAAVTITWDRSTDSLTAGYYVSYGIQSHTYSGYVDVGSATTAIINTQDSTTTYYFAVQAYSSSGARSDYSQKSYGRPLRRPLSLPH